MGFTSETVAAAAAAYNEQREIDCQSRLNADLDGSVRNHKTDGTEAVAAGEGIELNGGER